MFSPLVLVLEFVVSSLVNTRSGIVFAVSPHINIFNMVRGKKVDLYHIVALYQFVALTNWSPTNLSPYTNLSSIPISATDDTE